MQILIKIIENFIKRFIYSYSSILYLVVINHLESINILLTVNY